MYIKNKLGIYVYPYNVGFINNIYYRVNSISNDSFGNHRIINHKLYGILIHKK